MFADEILLYNFLKDSDKLLRYKSFYDKICILFKLDNKMDQNRIKLVQNAI
jgi:hypothetical protein